MNDMYYNDYFNNGFSCETYPSRVIQSNTYECVNRNMFANESSYSGDRVDNFFNSSEGFSKGNMQANIYKPYKLINPVLPTVFNEKDKLLLDVQKYGFAMWDLNLYLNTHPTDRNVMMLFEQNKNMYKKAKEIYESKYGALCLDNINTNSGYWSWNKSPWPWEGE